MKRSAVPAQAATVEVVVDGIRAPRWRGGLARFCRTILDLLGGGGEVAVLLCGDERMTALNSRYRGKDSPTDVLSFSRRAPGAPSARISPGAPSARISPGARFLRGSGGVPAGDLAISLETLARNAALWGVTEDEELKRLAVHGILHLAGMDHGRGKGPAMMRAQGRLLKMLEGEHIIR
jgi:probable rRNA maturation factor